ncbi:hypothetical protein EK904_000434 [Melospiza melodia maxima]|nr:hypothetical protein EK904_000434 [Melospiza melodia maxima]
MNEFMDLSDLEGSIKHSFLPPEGSSRDSRIHQAAVLQDGVLSLELKIATKQLSLKHQGKPVAVIRPHAMEGHLVQLKPLGPHFWWHRTKELCVGHARGFLLPMLNIGQQAASLSSPAAFLLGGILV